MAAGAAAIGGQLGPQALLPEEIITVPAAFAGGLATASAIEGGKVEYQSSKKKK